MNLLVSANGIDRAFHGLAQEAPEENQRIHGLIPGGRRNVFLHGQMSQEDFDLGSAGRRSSRERMRWKRIKRTIQST
jgi:hypothetical protein